MNIYLASSRFGPPAREQWQKYINWYGCHSLNEVVTMDQMLCPNLVERLTDEDWKHNVQSDYRTYFFRDFEYLFNRISYDPSKNQILLLTEMPAKPLEASTNFEVCGYDIVDVYCSTSVITNCGGFSAIFTREDLNHYGIVADFENALTIAKDLRRKYAFDQHCSNCAVWGIQRLVDPTPPINT
jgi:hypothetical protein